MQNPFRRHDSTCYVDCYKLPGKEAFVGSGMPRGLVSVVWGFTLFCFLFLVTASKLVGQSEVGQRAVVKEVASVSFESAETQWKAFLESFSTGCVFSATLVQEVGEWSGKSGAAQFNFTAVVAEGVLGESFQSDFGPEGSATKGFGWGELYSSGVSDTAGKWLCHPVRGLERVELGVGINHSELWARAKSAIPFRARWVAGHDILESGKWSPFVGEAPNLSSELGSNELASAFAQMEFFSLPSSKGEAMVIGIVRAGLDSGSWILWRPNGKAGWWPATYSIIKYTENGDLAPSTLRMGTGSPFAPRTEWRFSDISALNASTGEEAVAAWMRIASRPITDTAFPGGKRNGRVIGGRFEWYQPSQSVMRERELSRGVSSLGALLAMTGLLFLAATVFRNSRLRSNHERKRSD